MPYRGIDFNRTSMHADELRQAVGQTAIWRRWVSAASAVSIFGGQDYYSDQTVTAFFGQYVQPAITEHQTPAGEIVAGTFNMVGAFIPSMRDQVVWQGNIYRVESEAVPARIAGQYMTVLKRASGT